MAARIPAFKAVLGVVDTIEEAQAVVAALKTGGFRTEDLSALLPDTRGSRDLAHEMHTKAPEGAALGAGAGGLLGGALGLLVGMGAVAIPGLGPLLAAGPIVAALSGMATLGAVGGLAGGLVGLGVPEVEARQYEGKIRSGNVLLSVHVDDDDWRDKAKRIFADRGVRDVSVAYESPVPTLAPESPRVANDQLTTESVHRERARKTTRGLGSRVVVRFVDGDQSTPVPNVSHAPGSPESSPRLNHVTRWREEPWVKVSVLASPPPFLPRRSSPTAAAAARPSSTSPASSSLRCFVECPQTPA